MLIQLQKRGGLAVNPVEVSSMFFRDSNGDRVLEVRMACGDTYLIRHTPDCFDGDDIYAIHQALLEAE